MLNLSLFIKRLLTTGLILFCLASFPGCSESEKSKVSEQNETEQKYTDSLVIEMAGRDSATVLELLEESHEVVKVNSAMGVFVKGIDSLENGSTVFWLYSVNDTMPKVAADKLLTKDGDRIRWHFRKMGEK